MTCLDFENSLQELLDLRQRDLSESLADHALRCPACREMQQRLLQLQSAAASWRSRQPASVHLADAILRRLPVEVHATSATAAPLNSRPASDGRRKPSRTLAGWTALLASALALVIATGIGWRVSGNVLFAKRQASAQIQTAAVPARPSELTNTAASGGDRQLDVLLHDARDAYASLASHAWQQVSTANVLLPPADAPSPFGDAGSANGASESLSRPLAPLGKELREAVDSWLQQVFNSQDSST